MNVHSESIAQSHSWWRQPDLCFGWLKFLPWRTDCQLKSCVSTIVQYTVVRAIAVSHAETTTLVFYKSETLEHIDTKFALLTKSARSRDVPKLITIGCSGRPKHTQNITFFVLFCLCFYFFCVLMLAYSPKGESHKSQRCFKDVFPVHEVSCCGPVDDLWPEMI